MRDSGTHPARTDSGAQKSRVAVLVLHGVGQQAKFETLASFAAGLAEAAGVEEVSRTPLLIDDKLESALTVSLPGVELDLIEYYYQPLMQRQVALPDVTRWLVETGFHIRRLYQCQRKQISGHSRTARAQSCRDFGCEF